jgi:phosphoenolpyruvate carboxykinase (ATP)
MGVACYIINTGFFLEKKVTPAVTLGLIEDIVMDKAKFVPFGPFSDLEYLPIEGFEVNFEDKSYVQLVKDRMLDRYNDVLEKDGLDKLPEEALNAIKKVAEEI